MMGMEGAITVLKTFTIMAIEAGDTVYNPQSLRIRGSGPDIPEGFIKVNDQLQRSQAAPQPVPWWITQADQEAQRRKDQEELQAQINQQQEGDTSAQAARGIERAMQLEGVLGFDADRKRGVPVQEALMKWAPKMYFRNPSAVARISRDYSQSQPFAPTETQVGGQRLIQVSPRRFQVAPPAPAPGQEPGSPVQASEVRGPNGEVLQYAARGKGGAIHLLSKQRDNLQLSPSQKLQVMRTQLVELNKQIDSAIGDPEATKALKAQHDIVMEAISELAPSKSKAAAPAAKTGPDKPEARKEAQDLIKSRPKIADQVRARFEQTFGEDL